MERTSKCAKTTAATAAEKTTAATEGEKKKTVAVAAPNSKVLMLEKTARNLLNGDRPTYDIFTVDCFDAKQLPVALAQSDAKNEATVLKVLRDVGAALPENAAKAKLIIARLVEASPLRSGGQIATRWGWFSPGKLYINNNRWITPSVAGDSLGKSSVKIGTKQHFACAHFDESKDSNILGPAALGPETDNVFLRAGSLGGWGKTIGKIATYSSTLRLSIALPLAAPLVALLGVERFIVILTGPSSHGKTTEEIAAGSVIGRPSLDDIPNWNTSDPNLEAIGRFHNDNLLIIDDLKTAGGTDKQKFNNLQHRIHWFTSGGRRGRLKKAVGKITGRSDSHLSFSTLVLSSYEYPIAEIAERSGGAFDPGDLVRTLDVEATPPGAVMIFDALPKLADSEDPEEFAERLLQDIRVNALKYHGVLYDAWIKALVADSDRAIRFVNQAMDEFLAAAKLTTANPQEKRHAKHFALIYAAGAYAIHLKLLPWKKSKFKAAILKCHKRARARLRRALSGLAVGLTRLDTRLRDTTRIQTWPQSGYPQLLTGIDGWQKQSSTNREYCVIGPQFRKWFLSKAERNLVEDHLISLGWLKVTKKGRTSDERVNGGTTKVKCYHLVIPKAGGLVEH